MNRNSNDLCDGSLPRLDIRLGDFFVEREIPGDTYSFGLLADGAERYVAFDLTAEEARARLCAAAGADAAARLAAFAGAVTT